MKRSNRLVLVVGFVLAALAFVGVLFVLNQEAGPDAGPDRLLATVLVANTDIAIGDEVTPSMVEIKEIEPDAVEGTPMSDPSQLTGRQAVVPVPAGGQVNREVVGAVTDQTCISCALLPGEKAIAFQVDRVTGLDFLVLPGDHIDVVINQQIPVVQPTVETVNSPPGEQRYEAVIGLESAPTVKTVLQNKRVLYVSQARNAPGAEETPPPEGEEGATPEIVSVIIIFAGTDQDAELVKLAQNDVTRTGSLTAVLRAADDDVAEATTGVTLSLLIDRYGVPVPNIVLLQSQQ